jgi:hypothetical protein
MEQVLSGSRGRAGQVAQIMYTPINKCKNNKIKLKKFLETFIKIFTV